MSRRRSRSGLTTEIGHFVRANLSSTLASGVEYALVTGLVLLHVYYLAAATLGAITGAITDFSLKRHWAFDRTVKGAVQHEGMRYLLVSAGSLIWNLAVSYALVDGLHLHPVPGIIAASILVGFAWNYPLHRCFVFRPISPPPPPMPTRSPEQPPILTPMEIARRAASGGRS